jgi:transcriptional regulator with XRE-family HTH domain
MPDLNLLRQQHSTVETYAAKIGEQLRVLRKQHRLSLRQLAETSGVRLDVLQRVETGRWVPTRTELDAVLQVLT